MLTLGAVSLVLLLLATAARTPPRHAFPRTEQVSGDLEAQVAYWHRKATKRLRLASKFESQRNNSRERLRRVLYGPRSTGIPWLDQALCIHSYESVNWFLDGHHDGGMQFNPGTWRRAGGTGYAFQAHPMEQLYRAFRVWSTDGGSWREWSTHALCGV